MFSWRIEYKYLEPENLLEKAKNLLILFSVSIHQVFLGITL